MAVCAFPVCAFADNPQAHSAASTTVSKPAQNLYFKDYAGADYRVYSGTVISTTQNTTWKGYILVIQDVLDRLSRTLSVDSFNPQGVDGIFGENTRSAVVSFQWIFIGENDADGVVGPTTWWFLHTRWIGDLGSCNLSHVYQGA